MTKQEASEHFSIPVEILDEYEALGFEGERYDDSDLERIGTLMTLRDIGFTRPEIEEFMLLPPCDRRRCEMLEEKRRQSLDEIHYREKRLDHIDYLRAKNKGGKIK